MSCDYLSSVRRSKMYEWCPTFSFSQNKNICFPVLKNRFAATLNFKSYAKLFSKTQVERRGGEERVPSAVRNRRGVKWLVARQQEFVSASLSLFCPLARLVGTFGCSAPPPRSSSLRTQCRRNDASPQVTLVLWVHGSVRFAAKVLREVTRVGYGADDPEPGRAVRIRDDALVWAFRRPGGAPHLRTGWASTMWKWGLHAQKPTAMKR